MQASNKRTTLALKPMGDSHTRCKIGAISGPTKMVLGPTKKKEENAQLKALLVY